MEGCKDLVHFADFKTVGPCSFLASCFLPIWFIRIKTLALQVSVLKEHFSLYGDLSKVQLDDVAGNAETKTSTVSAHIYFTTRHAAEKAFLSGKIWKGHNLQFVWLINSSKSRKDLVNKETPSPSSKGNSDSSKATSQKPSTSGDGESEKPKGNDIVKDHTQPDEIHHSKGHNDE